jgi:glycosyltransferase involved in cell wall biosynthesis
MRLALYPFAVARFLRIVRANRPDVVHVHDDRSMLVAAPAVRLLRVPVFVRTYHMLSRARATGQGRLSRALLGIGYRVADFVARGSIDRGVAFVEAGRSDAIRDHGLSPRMVMTISNGVDTERFRPLASREPGLALRHEFGLGRDDLVVGAIGRLVTVKGHEILVDAFRRVARAEPRARLVLVGDGPQRKPLELVVGRSEAADRIRLVGARPAGPDVYGALDLLVYPSLAGAYGLVVLEAMACGLPVVASRLEGTDELIVDGTNGILVPAADPVALAGAILRLMADAAERHRLGTRARADVVARYSEAQMIERYEALYASLLEHRFRRAYAP